MEEAKHASPDPRMVALHRHWLNADSIRVRIDTDVLSAKDKEKMETFTEEQQELLLFGELHSKFVALTIWYSLLYVVVEGYREMKLTDAAVDAVLAKEEYVDFLRRFRNATFHYQADPLNEKLLGFLSKADSETWIKDLNRAFDDYFKAYPPINRFLGTFM